MLEKHIAHLFFKGLPLQPAFGSVYIVSSYGSHDAMSLQTYRFFDFANFILSAVCERLQITFHFAVNMTVRTVGYNT